MDVATVRTFLAAVSCGSFAAAAKRVNASPSAVTERIKQLEHQLGVRLFDRGKLGCRLTSVGRRFVPSAESLVRAWDQGRARVSLPPRYSRSVRVGGQHALWPTFLIPWLQAIVAAEQELAVRAVSAAASQLNRDLEEGELDIAFLYEPMIRKGFKVEQLAPDRLVLLTANPSIEWQQNYARIDWGENANAELAARLSEVPNPGLDLDLGVLALDWLVASGASGYVPERLAWKKIREGVLVPVENVPSIEFSPFVCWREALAPEIAVTLIEHAKERMSALMD